MSCFESKTHTVEMQSQSSFYCCRFISPLMKWYFQCLVRSLLGAMKKMLSLYLLLSCHHHWSVKYLWYRLCCFLYYFLGFFPTHSFCLEWILLLLCEYFLQCCSSLCDCCLFFLSLFRLRIESFLTFLLLLLSFHSRRFKKFNFF